MHGKTVTIPLRECGACKSRALSMVLDMLALHLSKPFILCYQRGTDGFQVGEQVGGHTTYAHCPSSLPEVNRRRCLLSRQDSVCLCFLMKRNGFVRVCTARRYCISDERRFQSWHMYKSCLL